MKCSKNNGKILLLKINVRCLQHNIHTFKTICRFFARITIYLQVKRHKKILQIVHRTAALFKSLFFFHMKIYTPTQHIT